MRTNENQRCPLPQRHAIAFSAAQKQAKELLSQSNFTVNGQNMKQTSAVYVSTNSEITEKLPTPSDFDKLINALNHPIAHPVAGNTLEDWYLTYNLLYFYLNPHGASPKFQFTTDSRKDWSNSDSDECYINTSHTPIPDIGWGDDPDKPMISVKWISEKILNIPQEPRLGAFVELNEKFTNVWINDLTNFSFVRFYPHEILNLIKGQKCSLPLFEQIYSESIRLRKEIELDSIALGSTSMATLRLKHFINAAYGMISSPESPIRFNVSDISNKIVQNTSRLLKLITNEFSSHIVYADTDTIYFIYYSEIERRLKAFIEKNRYSHHTYNTESGLQGLFIAKKKYIIKDRFGDIKIRGIKNV